jgi:23S rRNA pseudouridine1911/1915/1917 synthase
MSARSLYFTVAPGDSLRLDRFLTDKLGATPDFSGMTRSQVKLLIEGGAVTVDGALVGKAGTALKPGCTVAVTGSPDDPTHLAPYAAPLTVLYEDEVLIVIDKPAGLTMHPGAGNRDQTLVNALVAHFQAASARPTPELFNPEHQQAGLRPGVVHRLDRDTTGIVVVAKTTGALHHLSRQFAARTVGRGYLALVFSTPRGLRAVNTMDSGTIDAPIGRHPTRRTEMAITPEGRRAVTHWRVRERFAYGTLLEARLETGRTHQIRVHFTSIGCPLVGDRTYGELSGLPLGLQRAAERFGRQALHAYRLEFEHPTKGTRLAFESAIPADFESLLGAFRGELA